VRQRPAQPRLQRTCGSHAGLGGQRYLMQAGRRIRGQGTSDFGLLPGGAAKDERKPEGSLAAPEARVPP
jgi:hypothetical protein